MSRLNKLLAFFIVVVFLATAFLFVRISNQRKQELETSLVNKQKQEELEKERQKKLAEKKEIEDIKQGLDKTIGGKIESINQDDNSFVLDLDPLGNHQRYTIQTTGQTQYRMTYVDTKILDPNAEQPEQQEEVTETEFEIQFDQLKEGADAIVEFAKRIDPDKEEKLEAIKVNAVYYKIIK